MENIKTPELDKLQKVRAESQIIEEFLDYMEQRDYVMCEPCNDISTTHEACYLPTRKTKEGLLALFFEVDLNKCEEERRALLKAIDNKN